MMRQQRIGVIGCPPAGKLAGLGSAVLVMLGLASSACSGHRMQVGKTDGARDGETARPDSAPEAAPDLGKTLDVSMDQRAEAAGMVDGNTAEAARPDARLTVSPPSVSLGTVEPGIRGSVFLTVTNIGTAPSGAIVVSLGPSLSVSRTSLPPLAPQGHLDLEIAVLSTSEGALASWVSVAADPGAIPPLQTPVTGTFTASNVFVVSPLRIDLGTVSVGTKVVETTGVIAHRALNDLTIVATGAVSVDPSTDCTASLPMNHGCQIYVRIATDSPGLATGTVVVSAGGANPKVVTVPVSATVGSGR
jgi:hypothetical protein